MSKRAWIERARREMDERAEALPPAPLASPALNRRTFLLGTTAAGVAFTRPVGARQATPGASPLADPALRERLFSLGVASGEPLPDGVVLWTRLAPLPFEPDGGMGDAPVEVNWEIATDEGMTGIVQRGTATAEAAWAHSLHVEVSGLEPATRYWYRFRVGDVESPVARTRTAPAAGAIADRFRFAFASCQKWDDGLYTAYRDMAHQDVDLVIHLGDYIYESAVSTGGILRPGDYPEAILSEPVTLDEYRARYALYKLDPHLQEAHRAAPWVVTWDDHEVRNNYYGSGDATSQRLLDRRTAAYRAYYEHQPLREAARPQGPDLRLYRRLAFGDLLDVTVLDTRQYRSKQGYPCGEATRADHGGYCPDALDPEQTMLGANQLSWLLDGFDRTSARWSVLAQQVPFARIDMFPAPELESYGDRQMDKWDGYARERNEIITAMASAADARGFSPVVITGDVHVNQVWDLRADWDDTSDAAIVGSEFIGTSIATNGDEALGGGGEFTTLCGGWNGNPHNHLYDNHRGYVLCEMTADQWRTDYRVMPTIRDASAEASTLVSYVIDHGNPGVQQASGCEESGADA